MTGELLALAAMLMFGTNILVTKAASSRLNVGAGFVISVTVNLLFALLVFAVELALRLEAFRWDVAGVLLFMLAGACSTYLGRWFFFGTIARLGHCEGEPVPCVEPGVHGDRRMDVPR